jgi:hypothetical protein
MVKTKYKQRREERERARVVADGNVAEEEIIQEGKTGIAQVIPVVVAVLGVSMFTMTARGELDAIYGGAGLITAIICIFIEIIILNRGGRNENTD